MTKIKLLLKDLCARSPYGVKIHLETPEYGELIGTLDAVYPTEERVIVDNLDKAIAPINVRCGGFKIDENKVKPYLRSLSSMTEEEFTALKRYSGLEYDNLNLASFQNGTYKCLDFYLSEVPSDVVVLVFDWLNAHHFDYRGLIERDLALEAYNETGAENDYLNIFDFV